MEPGIYKNFKYGSTQVKHLYQGYTHVWPDDSSGGSPGPDILLNWISNGHDRAQPHVYFDTLCGGDNMREISVSTKFSCHSTVNECALFGTYKFEYYNQTPPYSGAGIGYNSCEYTFMLKGITFPNVLPISFNPRYNTVFNRGRIGFTASSEEADWTFYSYDGARIPASALTKDTPHIFCANLESCTLDDVYYKKSGNSANGNISSLPSIYLFAAHDYDTNDASKYATADTRIYYFKIYNTGTSGHPYLLRYFIPVLHYDISLKKYVPCFFDKVSDTYFYNLGTDDVEYEINGDYLLDYIERDTSGYLTYMSGISLAKYLNFNLGFTVGNADKPPYTFGENIVFGAISPGNVKSGLLFPSVKKSSTDKYMKYDSRGLTDTAVQREYNYYAHISQSHRADHYELFITEGFTDTVWIEFEYGIIPNYNNILTSQKSHSGTFVSSLVGCEIGLFGDSSMHSQDTTKIYYLDVLQYDYNNITASVTQKIKSASDKGGFIPVVHNGATCFYNLVNNTYIYNTGTGTPMKRYLGYGT